MNELCNSDDELINAVRNISVTGLLKCLPGNVNIEKYQEQPVFHILVETLSLRVFSDIVDYKQCLNEATKICYALSLHGFDINIQDEIGNIALMNYLGLCQGLYDDLVVAFLRCGSDCCLKNKDGLDCLQFILQNDDLPKHIRARILEFMPGIWRAVDSDDAGTVRRLINQWCTIDIIQHGMNVLQLAYSKGTENIIRVISGIGPSMNLAHAVLAGDIEFVRKILTSKCQLNINLKNMSERGSTPIYYAICNNDKSMVELLLQHGARLDISMKGDNENDIPLYFAVLSHTPTVNIDIARLTIPHKPVSVDGLYYKGRNIIYYCIEYNVDVNLFEDILRACSAYVLTQRVENNLDPRQYAVVYGKQRYVSRIDQVVHDYCIKEKYVTNRNILCLHGYKFTLPITLDGKAAHNDRWTQFLELSNEFEKFKEKLRDAVVTGDTVCVKEMLECKSWSDRGLDVCLADSRMFKDGQPLLHKAVLRKNYGVIKELTHHIVYNTQRKLDTIRDQYFRTALHYVYGMEDGKILICILEDLGMSEYVMDKDGRSPLAFKDRRHLQEMKDLLDYHIKQDLSHPEPDPWSVCLPLPITGYLKKCIHEHHKKEKRLYDKIDKSQIMSAKTSILKYELVNSDNDRYIKHSNSNKVKALDNEKGCVNDSDYSGNDFYSISETKNAKGDVQYDNDSIDYLRANLHNFSDEQVYSTLTEHSSGNIESNKYGRSLGGALNSTKQGDNSYEEEDSEISTDEGYSYNDYEGDQSEVDSDYEDEKLLHDRVCIIL
ncbi:hypothetical protein ACF0H5_006373 [Mactra antiquata]